MSRITHHLFRLASALARVLLFPVPLRLGFWFTLRSGDRASQTLRLDAGPWPPSSSTRALLHVVADSKDAAFWGGVIGKLRAQRTGKAGLR